MWNVIYFHFDCWRVTDHMLEHTAYSWLLSKGERQNMLGDKWRVTNKSFICHLYPYDLVPCLFSDWNCGKVNLFCVSSKLEYFPTNLFLNWISLNWFFPYFASLCDVSEELIVFNNSLLIFLSIRHFNAFIFD